MSNISQHPEWAFCGRCKYFVSYSPSLDFEKDFDKTFYGRCEYPKSDEPIVVAIAGCSMFERKEE